MPDPANYEGDRPAAPGRGPGPGGDEPLSPLERVLRLVTDVRAGEGAAVVALTASLFVLLTAYYMVKSAREPLILELKSGANVKSYAAVGQALLLIVVNLVYSAVASKIDRLLLVTGALAFFLVNLVVFAAVTGLGLRVGVPFFLWVGVFNYMSIAQIWSLAADLYTEEQGKRLFPMVGMGSAVGAVVGALVANAFFEPPFGLPPASPAVLMWLSAALLGVTVVLVRLAYRLKVERDPKPDAPEGGGPAAADPKARDEASPSKAGGFGLVAGDRYLLLLAALTLLLNWVNSSGEYIFDRTLLAAAADEAARRGVPVDSIVKPFVGGARSAFFAWVNALGIVLQAFFVSRFFKRFGVRKAIFVMPFFSLAGAFGVLAAPVLATIRTAKLAENSLDYSLQNTARQALYLPVSREAKYKAKAVIDTLCVRLGDVLTALVVFVGAKYAFGVRTFAAVNVVLVSAWLFVAFLLAREHRKRSAEA
ncbi:MAG TPA: Npt1/Npt2 family nucleotide transporter [Polyangiaceae bacterium]|nr:Npt1/Npt2 family nucleotide transporter [Polyangiaceae bacterium]